MLIHQWIPSENQMIPESPMKMGHSTSKPQNRTVSPLLGLSWPWGIASRSQKCPHSQEDMLDKWSGCRSASGHLDRSHTEPGCQQLSALAMALAWYCSCMLSLLESQLNFLKLTFIQPGMIIKCSETIYYENPHQRTNARKTAEFGWLDFLHSEQMAVPPVWLSPRLGKRCRWTDLHSAQCPRGTRSRFR